MNRRGFIETVAAGFVAVLMPWRRKPKTLYWVAADGHWNDARSWALKPGGPCGAGAPSREMDAVIAPPKGKTFTVRTDRACFAGNLTLDGEGMIKFDDGEPPYCDNLHMGYTEGAWSFVT